MLVRFSFSTSVQFFLSDGVLDIYENKFEPTATEKTTHTSVDTICVAIDQILRKHRSRQRQLSKLILTATHEKVHIVSLAYINGMSVIAIDSIIRVVRRLDTIASTWIRPNYTNINFNS